MSVTELRAGIADALDAVENDAEDLVITRADHELTDPDGGAGRGTA